MWLQNHGFIDFYVLKSTIFQAKVEPVPDNSQHYSFLQSKLNEINRVVAFYPALFYPGRSFLFYPVEILSGCFIRLTFYPVAFIRLHFFIRLNSYPVKVYPVILSG